MLSNRSKQIIILVFILLASSGHATDDVQNTDALANLLPATDWQEGCSWESDPQFYNPDDLFEYINGSADLYLAYGFKQLVTVNYMTDEDFSVLVDVYDMGNRLNAFGVFSNYRSPGNEYADIGTEATISDYHIRFFHGQYIVDLNASDATERIQKFMREVAMEIAARIDAPTEKPVILNLLPEKNIINKSSKYISEGLLGHQFFPKGLEAQYQIDSTTVKAFVVICDSQNDAASAFKAFSDYLQKRGENVSQIQEDELDVITGKIPYHDYGMAAIRGKYVFGIIDLPELDQGNQLLKLMDGQIKKYESE